MVAREAPPERAEFRVWRQFTTRWSDNDAYAHVNNAVFYQWFDSAVNAWLIAEGMLDIAAGNPIALVVSTSCTYFESVSYPQDVDVGLAVQRLGRSSICYRLGVFASTSERAAAQGEFVHVVVDRKTRTPVDIPFVWRTKLEAVS